MTGCATHQRVDSDVQAFSQLADRPADARYRWERLPSQQANPAFQARLEAAAAPALARAGLQLDEAGARYAVGVAARAQRVADTTDPWGPWGGFGRLGGWPGGWGHAVTPSGRLVPLHWGPYGRGGVWAGRGGLPPPTLLQREVVLTLRDLASGRIVYETHAVHDGLPHTDDTATLAAMFEAALRGFPQPAVGRQQVQVVPVAASPAASVVPAAPVR